jgi:hypothetical protein
VTHDSKTERLVPQLSGWDIPRRCHLRAQCFPPLPSPSTAIEAVAHYYKLVPSVEGASSRLTNGIPALTGVETVIAFGVASRCSARPNWLANLGNPFGPRR